MEIVKINLNKLNKKIIQKTAQLIKGGKIIIVPTDTVYGLIADATNQKAVEKLFKIKRRDFSHKIGIFIGDKTEAKNYVKIFKEQENFLDSHNTFILPLKKELPFQKNTLGIRVPDSKLLLQLLYKLKKPLAQTSANLAGQPTSYNIQEIIKTFQNQENQPDLILDAGIIPEKKSSRVVDLTQHIPKITRK